MRLEHVIQINAPADVVWKVTEDVASWPEWTPTVQSIARLDEGRFGVGSKAVIKQPGLPPATWQVTALAHGERFTWETRVRGMHMIATHEVAATATGASSTLRIEFSGMAARLLWPFIRTQAKLSLEQENSSLKQRCEQIRSTNHELRDG